MTPRTHTCGALRAEHAGQAVTLHGWVSGLRDKKTIFVVLRDRYGTVQVTLDEQCPEDLMAIGKQLALEYTVEVHGVVRLRHAPNDKMETGAIEMPPPRLPFVDHKTAAVQNRLHQRKATEEVRLKYRYLDLRQSQLKNDAYTSQDGVGGSNYLDEQGFCELKPILNRSTPEGAETIWYRPASSR